MVFYTTMNESSVKIQLAAMDRWKRVAAEEHYLRQCHSWRVRFLSRWFKATRLSADEAGKRKVSGMSRYGTYATSYALDAVRLHLGIGDYSAQVRRCEKLLDIINFSSFKDCRIMLSEEDIKIIDMKFVAPIDTKKLERCPWLGTS